MLSVKQRGIKYNFWVFGMIRAGIEPSVDRTIGEYYANDPVWELGSEESTLRFCYSYIFSEPEILLTYFERLAHWLLDKHEMFLKNAVEAH